MCGNIASDKGCHPVVSTQIDNNYSVDNIWPKPVICLQERYILDGYVLVKDVLVCKMLHFVEMTQPVFMRLV